MKLRLIKPFTSLFTKTFLWFWLTGLSLIAVTLIAVKLQGETFEQGKLRLPQARQLQMSTGMLQRHYNRVSQRVEEVDFKRLLFSLRLPPGDMAILVRLSDDKIYSRRALPPIIDFEMMTRLAHKRKPGRYNFRGLVLSGPRRVALGDEQFAFLILQIDHKPGFRRYAELPAVVRFGLPILVTGLVCFVFARSVVNPIRALRKTSQELASGKLDARVKGLDRRTDELGDLAQDFNTMAGKIETLMGAQSRLLADISHELRSPLARIQVALGLAAKQNPDSEVTRHLDRIELEAGRLDEMIGQVLNLSRLENQIRQLELHPVGLKSLLKLLIEDANFEAQQQNKHLALDMQDDLNVMADAAMLTSALENIVRNAIKYTPADTQVEIRVYSDDTQVFIDIQDQGHGVPEEALDKLFTPFYRVSDSRQRKSGGTGLGLAIAERAIKQHNGSISAQNAPDAGLLVKLVLPKLNLEQQDV